MSLPKGNHFDSNLSVLTRGCGGKHFIFNPSDAGAMPDDYLYATEALTPLLYRIEHTYSFTLIHNGTAGPSLIMNAYTYLGFENFFISPATKLITSGGFIPNFSENNNALLSSAFFGGTPYVYLIRDGGTSTGTAVEWKTTGATTVRMRWIMEIVTTTGTYLNPADTVKTQSLWYSQVIGKNPPTGNYNYLTSSGYLACNPAKTIGQLNGIITDKFGTPVSHQYEPAELTTKGTVPLVTFSMVIGDYSATREKRNYNASDMTWLLACPLP